ncbi:MAG: YabP/YqfC family sporulation protein, partial [Clostridiales bacterium]
MKDNQQQLMLSDRNLLEINGVQEVENFDALHVCLITNMGDLHIHGHDLNICHLDLQEGEVAIKGLVNSIEYKIAKDGRSTKEKSKNI